MKKNVKRLMASGNTSTKHKGHEAVIRYEAKHHPQWKMTAVEKNGIDLIATNLRTNKPERFIEVKATGKKNFEWREFETAQERAMRKLNHYVYFVRRAGKADQQVKKVKGSEMKKYFHKQVVKYLYAFPKMSGFHQKGWTRV